MKTTSASAYREYESANRQHRLLAQALSAEKREAAFQSITIGSQTNSVPLEVRDAVRDWLISRADVIAADMINEARRDAQERRAALLEALKDDELPLKQEQAT